MPRFAAIDMGSNASRLIVVDAIHPTQAKVLHADRVPLRLGHSVFVTGSLDPKSIQKAFVTLKKFKSVLDDMKVDRLRAVVTASARDADNSNILIDYAKKKLGIELEVIHGAEEARLIKLAVQTKLGIKDKRALLVDLGGGSLEISEVHHDEVRFSTSLPIGTVRLLESLVTAGSRVKVHNLEQKLFEESIERVMSPVFPNFVGRNYDLVAGTGGNFDTIAQLCPKAGGWLSPTGQTIPVIDVQKAIKLLPVMAKLSPEARQRRFKLKADRADVLVPALYVLKYVTDLARTNEVLAPGVGLKEGLIVGMMDETWPKAERKAQDHGSVKAAIQLGRKFHFDEVHASQVEKIAMMIFDQTKALHKLGDVERSHLRVASVLHDIGDFIHYASHHKHTQYIIDQSDLMGLTPEEKNMVGCIARYHRRSDPSLEHAGFKKLTLVQRSVVTKLAAILRIADGLDRSHHSKVRHVQVVSKKSSRGVSKELEFKVQGRDDFSLELWTSEKKSELFIKTFKKIPRFSVV